MAGLMRLKRTPGLRLAMAIACTLITVPWALPGSTQSNPLERQAPQGTWPEGFYRRLSESTIRWIAVDGRMCTVMNRDQLTAFGGDGVVRVVGDRSTFDRGRISTGICPWPNGIYRESRWDGIWQVLYSRSGNRYYCNVTTTQHLQAFFLASEETNPTILTVPNNSRLGFKRQWAGDCVWPGGPSGSEP